MSEYIERERVLEALTTSEPINNGGIKYQRYPPSHDEVLKRIKDLPAVDMRPIKHGKWEYDRSEQLKDVHIDIARCSCCGESVDKEINIFQYRIELKYHYCPNCGADMRKEEADG